MKQKFYFLLSFFWISLISLGQTTTLSYNEDVYTSGFPSVTLNNFTSCQVSASVTTSSQGYSGVWADRNYNVVVNGTNIGTYTGTQTIDISSYIPITSVQMNGLYSNWSWVDLTVNITSNNASMPATGPTVNNVTYVQGDTASPLSATLSGTGASLKWYTDQFGDNYSATGFTPSTATIGTTSYFVAQADASGCESLRSEIVVTVVPNTPATHLNFDGVNDVVNLGTTTSSLLNNSNFLTVEAWIKVPNVVGTKTIVGNHVGWGGTQFNLRVINNTLNAFLGDGYYGVSSAAGTIVADTWTHVSMVYDDTTLKIYINGVVVGSTSVPSGYSLANTSPQTFIGNSVFGGEIFQGDIDEVRIWNIVKTVEQLNGSKNCELQDAEPGLLAYYKFNQGVSQANNSTINTLNATVGPNGTLTNFALTGTTSNWLAGSPVTSGSIVPSVASVTTPVTYNQGDTASTLTATTGANGTGLMWYTTATGGTGSTTAPAPSTATVGSTSYWVSSTNVNGCESARTQIVVNVIVANDECSNAINLSVGVSSFNDFPVNVNLTTATNSGAPAPTCGNFQGGDVWYTATVPVSGNIVIETNGAGIYDTGLEVYTGACGTLSLVSCDDNSGNGDYSKIVLLGQTPGTVLRIRVWENVFGISNAQFQVSAYDYIVPATHLNFDGVNDFVVSTNAITNNTENQTYQAWFRIPSIPANNDRILQRGNDGTGGWSVQIDVNAAGRLSAGISATPDTFITGTTVLTPNTWYHATFVFENNNSLRLYLNGNLEASIAIGNRTLRNSDNRLRIGVGNLASKHFNGDIDEVRVWNKVLNATDILNTMNCELQATETGLVAYYKFNQGNDSVNNSTVNSLLDSSSNANNGTLTGFALTGTTSNWRSGSTITTGNACATLGNSDFENVTSITIYPNPSTGIFNIVSQQNASVEIYDLLGKLVYSQSLVSGTNSIDISNFNAGVYLLKATDANGNTETHKLIKN
ncbi:MAG: T9SS type A sorting domain-containing protein [Flavobacterium sp.]|nr:T9SS type A sorting domain-containing protein [Flavobacterium sp.]